MDNLPELILNQAIEKVLTRLQDRGIDITNVRSQIIERLENKILEAFLALMSPEQLDSYEAALNTEDPDQIQMVSAEIAATIPTLNPAIEQLLELEYQHLVDELTAGQ
jgi:hypothetical protein